MSKDILNEIRVTREIYSEFPRSLQLINEAIMNALVTEVSKQTSVNCRDVVEERVAKPIAVCTDNILGLAEHKLYI